LGKQTLLVHTEISVKMPRKIQDMLVKQIIKVRARIGKISKQY